MHFQVRFQRNWGPTQTLQENHKVDSGVLCALCALRVKALIEIFPNTLLAIGAEAGLCTRSERG
jgi:hypothetical protein